MKFENNVIYVYDAAEMPFDRHSDDEGCVHATGRVVVSLEKRYSGGAYVLCTISSNEYEGDWTESIPSIGYEDTETGEIILYEDEE